MRARPTRGFTLVEVLVTLAVTAVLFSMIGSILVSFITTQRKVEATLSRERIGAAILEVIARDLQGMFIYELPGAFRGTDQRGGGGDADSFEFVTTRDPAVREETQAEQQVKAQEAAAQRQGAFATDTGATGPVFRDPPQLTKITYSARDSRGNPGLLTVFRSEMLFIPPPPAAPVAGQQTQSVFAGQQQGAASQQVQATERFMEVYDRVRTFNVRYLAVDRQANTREWRDSWDDPQHYPEALEITVEIVPDPKAAAQAMDDRGRKLYRTIVSVPVTQPTPPQQQTGQPQALPLQGR